ncbi:zf-HC2 domain-containing protein [Streptomyces sp. NPDC020965]|uniref:zf-HC2 domain-containing protein n=1 Tax=Streptomyces sp. NPDC020965 TaxID=3365105 RepID=UPI0037BA0162
MTEHPANPHPPGEILRQYAHGILAPDTRHRFEPHLDACAHCRARLAPYTDTPALDRGWERLDRAIDIPLPGPWERLLLALGVPDHTARLLAAAPALRATWLLGTVVTLLFAALTARLAEPGDTPLTFFAVAPLLPAAGVAGSLGRRWDPAYELGQVAAPSAFRLVVLRTVAVLGATVVLTAAASLALPGLSPAAFGWLLPSCLVTVVCLLLLPRLGSVAAAAAAGACWLGAVTATRHSELLFSLAGQSVLAGLLIAAVTLLALLRADFDIEKGLRV